MWFDLVFLSRQSFQIVSFRSLCVLLYWVFLTAVGGPAHLKTVLVLGQMRLIHIQVADIEPFAF